jgi:hypothetical protein
MSSNITHGYDLVLEVTDQVINDLLPAAPFPDVSGEEVTLSIEGHSITFDYALTFPFDRANQLLYFDTSIPDGVVISTPFSLGLSHIEIDDTPQSDAAVNGTITVHHPIIAFDNATGQRCVGFDFSNLPANHIQVDVTSAPGIPLPPTQLEGYLAELVRNHLQNNVRTVTLICMTLEEDADPLTPGHLDVRVVNDHCLALLASSSSETSGDRDAFTTCVVASGANAALIVANATLLRDIACPQLIRLLELEGDVDELFRFDDSTAELTTEVDLTAHLPHTLVERVLMHDLRLSIGDNRLETRATLVIEGSFYRATAVMSAHASIAMTDEGELAVTYGADVVDTSIVIKPWAWILAIVLGPLLPVVGGIIAALLPILPALINPIFDAILSRLVGGLAGGTHLELAGLPVRITSVTLDDLTCVGRVVSPGRVGLTQPNMWLEGVVESSEGELIDSHAYNINSNAGVWSMTFAFDHHARYVARTSRMVFPIRFEWKLNDQPLQGTGSVAIGDIRVDHVVDGDRCEFSVASGESIDAYLWACATAYDGQYDEEEKYIRIEGSRTIDGSFGVETIAGPHWIGLGYGSYVASDLGYAAPPWGFATLSQLGYPDTEPPDETGQPPW